MSQPPKKITPTGETTETPKKEEGELDPSQLDQVSGGTAQLWVNAPQANVSSETAQLWINNAQWAIKTGE
jgi:hypothetical protein